VHANFKDAYDVAGGFNLGLPREQRQRSSWSLRLTPMVPAKETIEQECTGEDWL